MTMRPRSANRPASVVMRVFGLCTTPKGWRYSAWGRFRGSVFLHPVVSDQKRYTMPTDTTFCLLKSLSTSLRYSSVNADWSSISQFRPAP